MSAPSRLGRYEILSPLGQGAMGAVYRASDPALDRVVAIKTINAALLTAGDLREEFLERFRREARAAGRLSHPNIVSVFDLGFDEETSTPFIVMEYVPGVSLETVLNENPELPVAQAMEMLEQVCSALEEAHGNGVVHRDIKPANIFLDDRGRVKVGDFGVARLIGSDLTQAGVWVGTPGYTAPEVLQGGVADARADVFALGVLAYRLFTGKRPFSGTFREALAIDILQREPEPPRNLRPELPEAVAAAVMRALAKSPDARTPSARAFLEDLRAPVAPPETAAARPHVEAMTAGHVAPGAVPTRTDREQPITRQGRRWWPVAAVFAAALALGLGALLVIRMLGKAEPAAAAAQRPPVPATVVPGRRVPPTPRPVTPATQGQAGQDSTDLERARQMAKDAEELWREAQKAAEQQDGKGQEKGRGRGKKGKPPKKR
jgi:eukaryotic-like serine/threonine-protein kinase